MFLSSFIFLVPWRFLCLGWLTDHFSPSLTRSLARSLSSSLSFPLAFLPFLFLSFLKRSLFDFPPFHSFSLHFSRFLNPVLPPAALFIHFSPFFFLSFLSVPPPSFPSSPFSVSIYGQRAQAESPSGEPTESTFPWIQGGMESCCPRHQRGLILCSRGGLNKRQQRSENRKDV